MDGKWIPVILTERWKLSSSLTPSLNPRLRFHNSHSQKKLVSGNKLKRHLHPPSPFSSPPVRLIRQNLSEVCNQLAETRGGLEPCRL